jgi:hypothetical protein
MAGVGADATGAGTRAAEGGGVCPHASTMGKNNGTQGTEVFIGDPPPTAKVSEARAPCAVTDIG